MTMQPGLWVRAVFQDGVSIEAVLCSRAVALLIEPALQPMSIW